MLFLERRRGTGYTLVCSLLGHHTFYSLTNRIAEFNHDYNYMLYLSLNFDYKLAIRRSLRSVLA